MNQRNGAENRYTRDKRPQCRAAGRRWPPVVGRPDSAAAPGFGPLRLAAAGGRGSAPRSGLVDGGTPRGRGRCAPVAATQATGRGRRGRGVAIATLVHVDVG